MTDPYPPAPGQEIPPPKDIDAWTQRDSLISAILAFAFVAILIKYGLGNALEVVAIVLGVVWFKDGPPYFHRVFAKLEDMWKNFSK